MSDQEWKPTDGMPIIPIFIEEGDEDGRSTTPRGALIETNGMTAWTAVGDELEKLRDMIERMNAERAAAGLDPIIQVEDEAAVPAGKAGAFADTLRELARNPDVHLWVVDLKAPGAMAAAFTAQAPGVAEVNGTLGVTRRFDPADVETFTAGKVGRGKYTMQIGEYADGTPATVNLDSGGPDPEPFGHDREPRRSGKSVHPLLDAASVRAAVGDALAAARDAIVGRLPDGDLRNTLEGDVYDPAVIEALAAMPDDDADLLQAGTALANALRCAAGSDVPGALTWAGRVDQALNGFVGDFNADVADQIQLVWVDSEDRTFDGNIRALSSFMEHSALGGTDVVTVYTPVKGKLVEVTAKVEGIGEYDDDNYADTVLTVTLPDGSTLQDAWRIDGLA